MNNIYIRDWSHCDYENEKKSKIKLDKLFKSNEILRYFFCFEGMFPRNSKHFELKTWIFWCRSPSEEIFSTLPIEIDNKQFPRIHSFRSRSVVLFTKDLISCTNLIDSKHSVAASNVNTKQRKGKVLFIGAQAFECLLLWKIPLKMFIRWQMHKSRSDDIVRSLFLLVFLNRWERAAVYLVIFIYRIVPKFAWFGVKSNKLTNCSVWERNNGEAPQVTHAKQKKNASNCVDRTKKSNFFGQMKNDLFIFLEMFNSTKWKRNDFAMFKRKYPAVQSNLFPLNMQSISFRS